jgi:hypothetical protein
MRKTVLAVLMALVALCAFAVAEETAEDWVKKGDELFAEGSLEEADQAWDNIQRYNESIKQDLEENASAQVEEMWNRTYGGQGNDVSSSAIETKDSGYVIAGWTDSYGAGKLDAWLIKTDAAGNEIWNETYGGLRDDVSYFVQETMDDKYILIGRTKSYGVGDYDVWLIKTDSEGNEEWNRTFGGPNYDSGSSVLQTKDGGYIITGVTESYGAGDLDVWLIKTDSEGNEEWNRTFGGPLNDSANSALKTKDGGYIFTGYTQSYGIGDRDLWLVKTDSNGNELWNKTFGGFNDDMGSSIRELNTGGYIIAGGVNAVYNAEVHRSAGDAWLINVDRNGTMRWNKTLSFGNSGYNIATSIQETKDDGYILTGYSFGLGFQRAWALKADQEGNLRWTKTFDRRGNKDLRSIKIVGNDEYLLAGSFGTYETGDLDAWMIKIKETQ